MINFFTSLITGNVDQLQEGRYADSYTDPEIRSQIARDYRSRYSKPITPWTDPLQFDPLDPPAGWRYDPYYEIWIKND